MKKVENAGLSEVADKLLVAAIVANLQITVEMRIENHHRSLELMNDLENAGHKINARSKTATDSTT
jgi:hypothetical protein